MDAVVLAAGQGVRLDPEHPKQFLRLGGKPVLVHSLEVLDRIPEIDIVYITTSPDHKDMMEAVLRDYQLKKPRLVPGGDTRQRSVKNALGYVTSERVLIHEAARPFINSEFVRQLINTEGDAVVPVIAVPFTVAEGDDYMTRELKRDNLRNIQLPQVFSTRILKEAHDKFEFTGDATEDSQLIYRLRHAVRFVEGLEYNIKITTPLDLYWAEALFEGGLQTGGVTHA